MIPDWKIWTVILGLGVATYLIRFSFLGLLAGRDLPPLAMRALAFVPVTVLPAIAVPMVVKLDLADVEPQKLAAALAAFAAGIATKNVLAGIAGGIAGFVLSGLVMG